MAMADQTLTALIKSEWQGQGAKEAKSDLGGLEQVAGKLGITTASLATGGLALATGAIVGLGAGLVSSTLAAADAEQTQASLAATIQATGREAETSVDELYELAQGYIDVSTFGDDAIA